MAKTEQSAQDNELDGSRAPFLEHLEELRWRLWRAIIGVIGAAVVCFMFGDALYEFLTAPLYDVLDKYKEQLGEEPKLISRTVTGAFMFHFKAALLGGIFFGVPIILYQFWQFVAPGLYQTERKLALPFVFLSTGCFVAGGYFAYALVLPAAFDFLVEYSIKLGPRKLVPEIAIEDYLGITTKLLLAFGVVFEMPVVIAFLSWVGVVTHRMLIKFWRWAVVIAFILGAALTPPDVVSQLFLAVPLAGLYGISIGLSYIITIRRETLGEEDDPDGPDDPNDPEDPDDSGGGGSSGLTGFSDGDHGLDSENADEETLILEKHSLNEFVNEDPIKNSQKADESAQNSASVDTDDPSNENQFPPATELDFGPGHQESIPPSRFSYEAEVANHSEADDVKPDALGDGVDEELGPDEVTQINSEETTDLQADLTNDDVSEEEAFARRQLNLSLKSEDVSSGTTGVLDSVPGDEE